MVFPLLWKTDIVVVEMGGRDIILFFGGCQRKGPTLEANHQCRPLINPIAVDPLKCEWWHPLFLGRGIRPRMGAVLVSIGDMLFVFGGFGDVHDPNGPSATEADHIYTYSMAKYSEEARAWVWEVSDMPYPASVGDIRFSRGISVHRGAQIILVLEGTTQEVRQHGSNTRSEQLTYQHFTAVFPVLAVQHDNVYL